MTAHPTFTPSALSPEELDAMTVGRDGLHTSLVDRLQSAARDGSRPHTLLVAPRGGGKTHTLHVVLHRALANPATADRTLAVVIPEDSLAIGSFLDLLVEIARIIDSALGESARAMRRDRDAIGIEGAISSAAGDRMILLAIENLDRVFDNMGETGQGSLRAWIETSTAMTIFATAPALFSGVSSRSYPWYGSFMVESLPELSVDEGSTMLTQAAHRSGNATLASFVDSSTGLERLQVIHRLAGGSPRLWHILSDCIDVRSLDELVPAVEALLDRLAPYYQQRLWQLPTNEQRLVVELARGWVPRTVGDLAAAVGISNQSAATALGRLTSSRWVESSKTENGDRRASWYDLTEPLLRYHLQYREERGKPLRLIVEFLRGFYSRERLLDELAAAAPNSHGEHHLQRALFDIGGWFLRGSADDLHGLLASLRVWLLHEQAEYDDIGCALESVLVVALDLVSERRPVPAHLEQLVTDAIDVQSAFDQRTDKIAASLRVLRRHDWHADADDALTVFDMQFASDDVHPRALLEDCAAIRERRVSPPALMLRELWAMELQERREFDATLVALTETLDDVERSDRATELERGFLWGMWLQAIPLASAPPARRAGNAEVGWELILAIRMGRIQSPDLGTIMDAFTPETQSTVAGVVAMGAATMGVTIPAEHDPLTYVSEDLRGIVVQFIAEHG